MRDRVQLSGSARAALASDSLEDLMPRVARGDEAAFEQFYRNLAGPVFGLVQRVLRDPAQAEEVTQEVFVELWRTAARYEAGRGSVRAWALTIAHRRSVDRVRQAQASTDREAKVAHQSTTPDFDHVTDTVMGNLEREQVRRCVNGLTELQRESVILAYYHGHTYQEVAQLLNCPLGTVKTRMRDGLIRLRDCMGAPV
ncbi:ECF RNA polymerase sigma factor SigK [Kibdelosporangium lantanae]